MDSSSDKQVIFFVKNTIVPEIVGALSMIKKKKLAGYLTVHAYVKYKIYIA